MLKELEKTLNALAALEKPAAGVLAGGMGMGWPQWANRDESKVGSYTLPDPLRMPSGHEVRTAHEWMTVRRPQILRLFQENVYGRSPGRPEGMWFERHEHGVPALGGKARRTQVTIHFTPRGSRRAIRPVMRLLVYTPARAQKPAPIFVGLNFRGNTEVSLDPGIRPGVVWNGKTKRPMPEPASVRGSGVTSWPLDILLSQGFGLATANYCDLEPDFDGGIRYGVRPLFFKPGQTRPAPDDWGALGAWGWGLSRALDYLETDPLVDAKHAAAIGHSRLGKAAVWGGAQDARFALVVSNDSGEAGAALARRNFGETAKSIFHNFPWWFCSNFGQWGDQVNQMPVDQNMLLALVAPRPLYVASGIDDLWEDPHGEFLSALAVGPVYRLFGLEGLTRGGFSGESPQHPAPPLPPLSQPIMHQVGYHVRPGGHAITPYDWRQYVQFARLRWGVQGIGR